MLTANSNSSYQYLNDAKSLVNQNKKKIINISINRGPTPIFQQKSINIVGSYKETSEIIKNKNLSKQKKFEKILFDEKNKAAFLSVRNSTNVKKPNESDGKNCMINTTGNINITNNFITNNYSQISNSYANNNNSSINSTYIPKNTLPIATLNDSNLSKAVQVTFTHRNYNDTVNYYNTLNETLQSKETKREKVIKSKSISNLSKNQTNINKNVNSQTLHNRISSFLLSVNSLSKLKSKNSSQAVNNNIINPNSRRMNILELNDTKELNSKSKNDISMLKNSKLFKDIKLRPESQKLKKSNNISKNKIDYTNNIPYPNESVEKVKTKFKNQVKTNKSVSLINIKQRYKELLKNKSIPASLLIKSFKLSQDNTLIATSTKNEVRKLDKTKILANKDKIKQANLNDISYMHPVHNNSKPLSIDYPLEKVNNEIVKKEEHIEEDNFDDLNTIIKRINFNDVSTHRESIFSKNNFVYKNYEKKFNSEFDFIVYPNFEKRLSKKINKDSYSKDKSLSTQDTSSKKQFSPVNNIEISSTRVKKEVDKVNLFKVHLSKLK